jgi:hypothetical protein
MKVRITQCTPLESGPVWYRNQIGKVYEVVESDLFSNLYLVYPWTNRGILKDDCEIVKSAWNRVKELLGGLK